MFMNLNCIHFYVVELMIFINEIEFKMNYTYIKLIVMHSINITENSVTTLLYSLTT